MLGEHTLLRMMENLFRMYHSTTRERLDSILENGLQPGSSPTWFRESVDYVMLSDRPWPNLNGKQTVMLKVTDPALPGQDDPEGLRWPYPIASEYIEVMRNAV